MRRKTKKSSFNPYKWVVLMACLVWGYNTFTTYHQNIGYERALSERTQKARNIADATSKEYLRRKIELSKMTPKEILVDGALAWIGGVR